MSICNNNEDESDPFKSILSSILSTISNHSNDLKTDSNSSDSNTAILSSSESSDSKNDIDDSPSLTNSTTSSTNIENIKNSQPEKKAEPIKNIRELNEFISCYLCKGYLIDATTIIECLHSFCRTCILKYLDNEENLKSRFCPKCDTQIHKTKPKINIRSDPTLQDIVYKLVPDLFKNEMSRRKEFYQKHLEAAVGLSNEEKGEINGERLILSGEDWIQITIEYFPEITDPYKLLPFNNDENLLNSKFKDLNKRRYLLCKAGMKVLHLKKFIRSKYELENNVQVDLFYKHELLKDDYTIMDMAYIYSWRRHMPIPLYYIIMDSTKKLEEYHWLFSQNHTNVSTNNKMYSIFFRRNNHSKSRLRFRSSSRKLRLSQTSDKSDTKNITTIINANLVLNNNNNNIKENHHSNNNSLNTTSMTFPKSVTLSKNVERFSLTH